MIALRFQIEIPYWCSFGDFSSLNIRLTYPFPPVTTLFGLIQNALAKPAIHCISDKKLKNKFEKEVLSSFSNLKFSILINESGEKIEDFTNIHKGNRKEIEDIEENLKSILKISIESLDHENEKELLSQLNTLKRYGKYLNYTSGNKDNKEYRQFKESLDIFKMNNFLEIKNEIDKFWAENSKGKNGFNLNKQWISTQIYRQKLVNPSFTIYLISNEKEGEYSIENIYKYLNNPKRSLYIGESDDVVIINNIDIINIEKTFSSHISSIIPGIYSNSELVKVPINLKFNKDNDIYKVCSIPNNNDLNHEIECYTYEGENFVFI